MKNKITLLLGVFLFCLAQQGRAQIITTIAGDTLNGYNGDNMPAVDAALNNPTFDGALTTQSSGSGTFSIYTIEGQEIGKYAINSGNTPLQLPVNIAAGMYMGVFKPDAGGKNNTVQLVYQPY